jgi:hypothetical protein
VKEGGTIPSTVTSDPKYPPTCCTGLRLIKPLSPNEAIISGICTAKCGNGICNSNTENTYNCPQDCYILLPQKIDYEIIRFNNAGGSNDPYANEFLKFSIYVKNTGVPIPISVLNSKIPTFRGFNINKNMTSFWGKDNIVISSISHPKGIATGEIISYTVFGYFPSAGIKTITGTLVTSVSKTVNVNPDPGCYDSDSGENIYLAGWTYGTSPSTSGTANQKTRIADSCSGNILQEYYCDAGYKYVEDVTCLNGCLNGACLQRLPPLTIAADDNSPTSDVLLLTRLKTKIGEMGLGNVSQDSLRLFSQVNTSSLDYRVTVAIYRGQAIIIVGSQSPASHVTFALDVNKILVGNMNVSTQMLVSDDVKVANLRYLFDMPCTDTDGGKNFYVKGTATGIQGGGTDYCYTNVNLAEYYCDPVNQWTGTVNYNCPYGCSDGACNTPAISEETKIETANTKLNIGEPLADVKPILTNADLPNLLVSGTYMCDGDAKSAVSGYTQSLAFGVGRSASITFIRDNDMRDSENPYIVLYGPRTSEGSWFMRYNLEFTSYPQPESLWYPGTTCGSANELCDFEGTYLTLLGKEYYVSKAERNGNSITWEMMRGIMFSNMNEGETKTFAVNGHDYEVTIDIIRKIAPYSVVLTINGQSTKELLEGQTNLVSGIEVGIQKVLPVLSEGKSQVQFYLGAEKLVLSDNDVTALLDTNARIGSAVIDDIYSDFTIAADGNAVKLQKLQLTWAPQEKIFIYENTSVSLPALGSYKVTFNRLVMPQTDTLTTLKPDTSGHIILGTNLQSGYTTVPLLHFDGANYDSYGRSPLNGQGHMFTSALNMSEGDYILLSNAAAKETHIAMLESITSNNIARLRDIGDSVTYECIADGTGVCGVQIGNTRAVLKIVGFGTGMAEIDPSSDVSAKIYTSTGLTIDLGSPYVNGPTKDITFIEENSQGTLGAGSSFKVTLGGIGGQPAVTAVSDINAFEMMPGYGNLFEYGNSGTYGYLTRFGTRVEFSASTQHEVSINYPGEEAYAEVFVGTPN